MSPTTSWFLNLQLSENPSSCPMRQVQHDCEGKVTLETCSGSCQPGYSGTPSSYQCSSSGNFLGSDPKLGPNNSRTFSRKRGLHPGWFFHIFKLMNQVMFGIFTKKTIQLGRVPKIFMLPLVINHFHGPWNRPSSYWGFAMVFLEPSCGVPGSMVIKHHPEMVISWQSTTHDGSVCVCHDHGLPWPPSTKSPVLLAYHTWIRCKITAWSFAKSVI